MEQTKLTSGQLLNSKGHLNEAGYAFDLVKTYDRSAIKANALRIKEWDYYLVYNQKFGLALTVADNSYMGLVSATFLDFENLREHTFSPMQFFTLGKLKLPSSSREGDVHYKSKQIEIHYLHEKGGRHLTVDIPRFENGLPLKADIVLTETMKDSMVIATPFKDAPKAFYYNQKIIGMKAQGTVNFNDRSYSFDPDSSFGILDWGRGVWTYKNTWYWSASSGLIDNNVFGFNLGYGFGDNSAASENMLFYKGKAHKLAGVSFNIPTLSDGGYDFMSPWEFTSTDSRFEATFTPILDRSSKTSLGILESDQHQVFGFFDGKAVLDDGKNIEMKSFLGFAEKVMNKW